MTVAENLVLSRSHVPAVVKWADERRALDAFMAEERTRSHDYGGRSIFGWEPPAAASDAA